MSRKPTGNPNGRPPKKINQQQFEALCGIQCTEEEVLEVLDCSRDTLNKWCKETYDGETFCQVFKKKSAGGKASLRRRQWQLAERNTSMAIWLGKQYLGQRDNMDIKADTTETPVIRFTFIDESKGGNNGGGDK